MTTVREHQRGRKGSGKKSKVRRHYRKGWTHRVNEKGQKEVFVRGHWKHDDYPNAPKAGWSYERLLKERDKLMTDLEDGLRNPSHLPSSKYGLLTRRIKKINKFLKQKQQ